MQYKGDWPQGQERLSAWWDGEVVDRPCIMVTSPRPGSARPAWDGWGFARFPDDPERVVRQFQDVCSATNFGGEAFPNLWINLGAGVVAAFLGASPVFFSQTVWFETPMEWDQIEDIRLDPENLWWKRVVKATSISAEKGQGKFLVGMTDLGGTLDIAHSLRGKKRLMIDLFRNGGKVLDLCWKILDIWHECYDLLDAIIQEKIVGRSAWMGIWSAERWYPIQCDYAYMLSPEKFRTFVLPFVKEQCERLDRTVYHLDGYGQIPHLDDLLSIDELDAIQWVPGAGKPQCGSSRYFSMYRKVREAGKGLVLSVQPGEVERVCREVGAEGILFQTSCSDCIEAERLLERSEEWI